MIFWIDAQLSPSLARWLAERFGVQQLGHRDSTDLTIFRAARDAGAIVVTKDSDFPRLLDAYGPPPQVLWVTLGNTSNARIKEVLDRTFPRALSLLKSGEVLVEISEGA